MTKTYSADWCASVRDVQNVRSCSYLISAWGTNVNGSSLQIPRIKDCKYHDASEPWQLAREPERDTGMCVCLIKLSLTHSVWHLHYYATRAGCMYPSHVAKNFGYSCKAIVILMKLCLPRAWLKQLFHLALALLNNYCMVSDNEQRH